jgi:hypothetical protein
VTTPEESVKWKAGEACPTRLDTAISTLGDLAFVGRILHASGKVLAVAKGLDVTGDILEISAAGYQAKKAIDLYIKWDLSEAHSHALQATLRLPGKSRFGERDRAER